ncbi:ORF1309 [White spot syndrome virus]|uniref:ORF1309 n=1 Tax=White spot syndrome virus TaxID=342409 RepID=A0A2D3I622_9VIRU|nr:ORF1309 [White spot syndrome virus]
MIVCVVLPYPSTLPNLYKFLEWSFGQTYNSVSLVCVLGQLSFSVFSCFVDTLFVETCNNLVLRVSDISLQVNRKLYHSSYH